MEFHFFRAIVELMNWFFVLKLLFFDKLKKNTDCDKRRTEGGGGNGVGLRPAAELLPVGVVVAVDLVGRACCWRQCWACWTVPSPPSSAWSKSGKPREAGGGCRSSAVLHMQYCSLTCRPHSPRAHMSVLLTDMWAPQPSGPHVSDQYCRGSQLAGGASAGKGGVLVGKEERGAGWGRATLARRRGVAQRRAAAIHRWPQVSRWQRVNE
jgi:hypothetical protein